MHNPFFSLACKLFNNNANKPIKPPSPFELGQVLLNELADCQMRLKALEQPREVQTHFANHGLEIQKLKDYADNFIKHIEDHEKRLKDLDQKYFSFLACRIASAHAQPRRKKNGRFAKAARKHVSA